MIERSHPAQNFGAVIIPFQIRTLEREKASFQANLFSHYILRLLV
jgi:hypothetical protein